MHAMIVRLTIKDLDEDLEVLHGQVVPAMSKAPGFVTGFWTRKGNDGLSVIVFDSEDAANAAAEQLRSTTPDVATLDDIEVREVVANA